MQKKEGCAIIEAAGIPSMRRRNRLVSYILLNILISAATILIILVIWDHAHPALANQPTYSCPTPGASLPASISATAVPILPTATFTPGSLEIASVVGAGDVHAEVIQIQYTGGSDLSLAGWSIRDDRGNEFIFPAMILYQGGAVKIHSAAGLNTSVDLYWNQNESMWKEGETVHLIDPQGTEQATYQIP